MSMWWVALAGVLALLGVAALLSAAQTVLSRLDVVHALRLDERDEDGAEALLELVEEPARPLNALLLLSITVRITAAALLTAAALSAGGWLVALAALGLIIVSFVLADVVPRRYVLRHLERTGLGLAPAIALVTRIVAPVAGALGAAGRVAAGRDSPDPFSSDQELRRLLSGDGEEADVIEADERAMIHSIFELGDTVCREIMVPRTDMVTVDETDDLTDVVDVVVDRGYSRVPVTSAERGEIVGIVYAKDLLERLRHGGRSGDLAPWTDLVREPMFVPEFKRADELLRDLRKMQVHLAIVVDEYGAVAGLVTIEDILEEIVGEIVDEYDVEEPPVVRLDDRRLRVNGRVTVHELNGLLDAELPEDHGWDTVGGLVIGVLGHIPEEGERIVVDSLTVTAERVQGRRVNRVIVAEADDQTDPSGEPAARQEQVR